MGSRTAYNQCMIPWMKGLKSKEERQMSMCIGAKLCSSKAKTEDAARRICLEPKPPKTAKASKRRKREKGCEDEVLEIAKCMVDVIDMNLASNINSVEMAISNAMFQCKCGDGTET